MPSSHNYSFTASLQVRSNWCWNMPNTGVSCTCCGRYVRSPNSTGPFWSTNGTSSRTWWWKCAPVWSIWQAGGWAEKLNQSNLLAPYSNPPLKTFIIVQVTRHLQLIKTNVRCNATESPLLVRKDAKILQSTFQSQSNKSVVNTSTLDLLLKLNLFHQPSEDVDS